MTQPLNRLSKLEPQGEIDEAAGEFWVANPFLMQDKGQNLSAFERNRLFLNHRGDAFLDASYASSADIDSDSRIAVAADFDLDGAPDLLIGSAGGGPLRMFRNRFPKQHRVHLHLRGQKSNRSAIGARVVVRCGERRYVRDLFAANGHAGQGPPQLLLGLGDATRIDELTIHWPCSAPQTLSDLPVDSRISVQEGDDRARTRRLAPIDD